MLTLTRSVGESIRIGEDIEVYVVEVRGGTVRLGFKAPREVTIHREEVYRQISEARSLAAEVTADALGALAAFAPGTGTPQVGGLTSVQILELVRALLGLDIVGCDLVEVSPPYDNGEITSLLAANLLFELLCVL